MQLRMLDPLCHNRKAVIICMASFAVIFTACGTNFAFGVYQELYQSMSAEPGNPFSGASPADIGASLPALRSSSMAEYRVRPHRHAQRGLHDDCLSFCHFLEPAFLATAGHCFWRSALLAGLYAGLCQHSPLAICLHARLPAWHRHLLGLHACSYSSSNLVWTATRPCPRHNVSSLVRKAKSCLKCH
jgi:hypothetical protein